MGFVRPPPLPTCHALPGPDFSNTWPYRHCLNQLLCLLPCVCLFTPPPSTASPLLPWTPPRSSALPLFRCLTNTLPAPCFVSCRLRTPCTPCQPPTAVDAARELRFAPTAMPHKLVFCPVFCLHPLHPLPAPCCCGPLQGAALCHQQRAAPLQVLAGRPLQQGRRLPLPPQRHACQQAGGLQVPCTRQLQGRQRLQVQP
jgi:hypothetical protein